MRYYAGCVSMLAIVSVDEVNNKIFLRNFKGVKNWRKQMEEERGQVSLQGLLADLPRFLDREKC